MAPIPHPHGHLLPLSTASSQLPEGQTSEKALIETFGQQIQPVSPKRKLTKMFGARAVFVALLVGCLVVVGLAHTDLDATNNVCSEGHRDGCLDTTASQDKSALSRLIDSASPEALHRFLHTVTGFQHGVFDSDQAAVKAVLEIDPALSSTVAQLQRRQGNSTTTDESTIVSNTQTTTTPTEQPTTPITPTTTTDPAPTTVESPTTADQDPTTAVVPPTSDTVVVPPMTTTDTSPLPPTTTTAQTTTTAAAAATSNGQSTTEPSPTTNPNPNPTITTATSKGPSPTAKPTSKTSTHTFTLPGGAVTTVTSITVFTSGATDSPTGTATGEASLQSGAAVPGCGSRGSLFEILVGGAVAAAMLA